MPAPVSPPPLSPYNAYTSWPGGVDPTAALYKSDNQHGGTRRHRRRKTSRKHRRTGRGTRRAARR